ncbi:epidermal retinol dehydrogenase 2 [Macrosteles quadrilineatus]|uniref:epidermal retinol dehydrogenase 2 n=1 Tax=Macrosteles quadrilineatus TaxID=74068 RepID=UPI0023E33DC5|nr:epidermal retinol dehydrogenase 2 [Macrosteles quadrilineatus]XP_054266346.1 epidermal retinol dehydrogenase 2 [Macrosteles quadrilineatus]XP_054266347.1 epidermal retinol dehydrogenase 2 [Macrosteles quadrilineatus]XP_054266348.1 epidermal retinol dehydrogenase 2 [Macrosteles quadrilineatus]
MISQLTSVATLLVDITILLLKVIIGVFEALYQTLVPVHEKSVANETVLITGTGHGIGRELALQFAQLGAKIVCVDINKEGNEETVKELKDRGFSKVHRFECDVSDRDQVVQLAAKVQKEVGDVTYLVNNAGIMPCHPFSSSSADEIKKIFDINVFAHFWMLQMFLPSMVRNNHGHVVGISSMAGVLGLNNLVPYCSSKFAVRGLMEALAEELREDKRQLNNIKFTTIFPYIVNTGLCKKPRIRFPGLLGIVSPQDAAKHIIQAVRRDYREISIPSGLLAVNYILRMFPVKVTLMVKDFLDSGLESHD